MIKGKTVLPGLVLLGLMSMFPTGKLLSQPVIITQPTNAVVNRGDDATFTVLATGTGTLTYQWRLNGTNLPNNMIMTMAGKGSPTYSGDGGLATNAAISNPSGVAMDAHGNLFIADTRNQRIRRVDIDGIITTVAGTNSPGFGGDGGLAVNARLYNPSDVTVDDAGNVFIADTVNSRIRKMDSSGIISTVTGSSSGFSGDDGAATNARLWQPYGVALDEKGDLFIADSLNNRVRKVDTNGIITTVAGNGTSGYSGDGGVATNAELNQPHGVAIDSSGNLFIADYMNNRVRMVDTGGNITTLAGTNYGGFFGDGGPATNAMLNRPSDVAVDRAGNVFFAEYGNSRIREIDTNGIITTVAGRASSGFFGDNGAATNASLYQPYGIALTRSGMLIIADSGNNRIRKCTLSFGTLPDLPFNGVNSSDAGNYDVVITDSSGSVTSSVVSLTVEFPPVFTVQPKIRLTSDPVGFAIGNAVVGGQPPFSYSWIKDGASLEDNGHYAQAQTTNLVVNEVSLADAGNYQLAVSNVFGVVTSSVVPVVIHCVNVAGTDPVVPYSTWASAATNIQNAIDASAPEEIILVTNGLYSTGGKSMDGTISNRVAVDKPILVQSVNGSEATVIQGAWDSISTNGPAAVRCAWLTNNAILSGFTLRGGATRRVTASPNDSMCGGGILGTSTNATVCNSVIVTNYASYEGGGTYSASLFQCMLIGNHAVGSGQPGAGVANAGAGGGAAYCNLKNCVVSSNYAEQSNGGGAQFCEATNCVFTENSAALNGGAVNYGVLVNCTITRNISSFYSSGYGAAVYGANLANSIVFGNRSGTSYPNTNYASCSLTYSCADPLPPGTGNINVDPQWLSDGIHLADNSPCIGAGTFDVASGSDIDGQSWNNPPSIGCDEWHPEPVIAVQPKYHLIPGTRQLAFDAVIAGQPPFKFSWSRDRSEIQDDSHHVNSASADLRIDGFGPDDSGAYQFVVSNNFEIVTSRVAQLNVHVVNGAGMGPVPPYSTWATAATNIQDAIDVASAGDVVLVTNGIYATGGKVMVGDLTNRVALDKALTVTSVNGYGATVIQGAWDAESTNGPGAVRCVYLADGAVLNGFTVRNGATRVTGGPDGGPLESGGGIWCDAWNCLVADCVISNNSAIYGGGAVNATLNNCLLAYNQAGYGGAANFSFLNNCTVVENYATKAGSPVHLYRGAGTFAGVTSNSIVLNNFDIGSIGVTQDNYAHYYSPSDALYYYSCTSPTKSGIGNTNVNPQFLDLFHIASTSPCRGAGNPDAATGADLDGEIWTNPPSMGCDEVIPANFVGPLEVALYASKTNLLAGRFAGFTGYVTGRVARVEWSFGDGPAITNFGADIPHAWTNSGSYTVNFTAFNNDHPAGVSASTPVYVDQFNSPVIQSLLRLTNGFQFQFDGQSSANYTVQYTTNLTPPVTWQELQFIPSSGDGIQQITDVNTNDQTRFYRVKAQ